MLGRDTNSQWRVLVGATVVSGALSVLATLLALGYINQKRLRQLALQESQRASQAAAAVQDAAHRRIRARDQAEELVEFILEDLRDELDQIRRTDLLAAAAGKAVTYFDNLPPELVTPESQAKRASILVTLADAHYQQGNHDEAIATIQRAVKLRRELLEAGDPGNQRTVSLGRTLGELGLYQNQSGQHDAARNTFLEVLKLYEDRIASGAPDGDGWLHHGLTKAHLGLGEVERLQEQYPAARAAYAQAITHITVSLKRQPLQISFLTSLMLAHNDTGVAFMHEENPKAAEQSLRASLEPSRALQQLEPKNRRWEKELATTLLNLGALLHKNKEYARAEPYLREALALRQGLASWDPKNARWMRQLAHAWHRMALFQFDTGDTTNALASSRNALDTQRRLLGIDPDEKQALQEIKQYAATYQKRLDSAGMTNDAARIVLEARNFTEADRDFRPIFETLAAP